jgi:hypothetical protein
MINRFFRLTLIFSFVAVSSFWFSSVSFFWFFLSCRDVLPYYPISFNFNSNCDSSFMLTSFCLLLKLVFSHLKLFKSFFPCFKFAFVVIRFSAVSLFTAGQASAGPQHSLLMTVSCFRVAPSHHHESSEWCPSSHHTKSNMKA